MGDCGHGRDERLDVEGDRVVVVDRELRRHLAGRSGERAGDGRERGGDSRLAGAAGLLLVGVDDHALELQRDVPLPRVEVVVPAGLEEVPVAQVQAAGQGQRQPVGEAAHHLRLQALGVDHEARVDRDDRLGHPRTGHGVADLAVDGLGAAVDLHQARRWSPCTPCGSRCPGRSRAASSDPSCRPRPPSGARHGPGRP